MSPREALVEAKTLGYCMTSDGRIVAPSGKVIRGTIDRLGYVSFKSKKYGKNIPAHRLQAYQKFGDALFGEGIQVRHLDGNPSNNCADNIEIGTASQNAMDKPSELRRKMAIHASRRVIKHDYTTIKRRLSEGASYNAIMREFGIRSKGVVSYIAHHSLTLGGVN